MEDAEASGELFGNQRRMKSDRTVGAVFTTGLIGDGVLRADGWRMYSYYRLSFGSGARCRELDRHRHVYWLFSPGPFPSGPLSILNSGDDLEQQLYTTPACATSRAIATEMYGRIHRD